MTQLDLVVFGKDRADRWLLCQSHAESNSRLCLLQWNFIFVLYILDRGHFPALSSEHLWPVLASVETRCSDTCNPVDGKPSPVLTRCHYSMIRSVEEDIDQCVQQTAFSQITC